MTQKSSTARFKLFVWLVFIFFVGWWVYINTSLRHVDHYSSVQNQIWSATYGVMSLIGGIAGLVASRKWGGYKSLIGRSLMFFSFGLLAQEFGQLAYSYYLYVDKIDIPYPSVGDIGYFASVLFYIYAAWQLAKAAGVKVSVKDRKKKLIAIILPLIMLIGSYLYFLRDYQFDFSSVSASIRVILDFGYPLGQALYISIALMTYLLSKKLLGGVMRNKILFILFALLVQYIADFSFLVAAKDSKVFPAGSNDLLYLIAYTVMTLALTSFIFSLKTTPADSGTEKN